MAEPRTGVVSVILVNFRGATDTIEAIGHLRALDWPQDKLEIVVVENGSGDDSATLISAAAPEVKLVQSRVNRGFAGGCNFGVAASTGEFVAFLNSDAKPHPEWVGAAMSAFAESEEIGAVASRVLDWSGEHVDFVDAAITWFGMGYKPAVGDIAGNVGTEPKDVLFGTGAAMFVRRSVFDDIGGFDERLFMFFEDVDLGWRLNLRGWRYRYQPESIAFHKHHEAVRKYGTFRENYFLERNALIISYKNLSQERLDAVLPAALGLAIRRAITRAGLDSTEFDFRSVGEDAEQERSVSKNALATIYGIDQFVAELPELIMARGEIQRTRVLSDSSLWRLFGRTDVVSYKQPGYLDAYENLVEAFPVTKEPRLRRVLILTGDPIGAKMAGPAIRAFHIASALSGENQVTLATTSRLEEVEAPFALTRIRSGDDRTFSPWEAWADVIIFQGHAMASFSALQITSKIVVADIYDPMHLEQLEQARELPYSTWVKQVRDATDVLNQQLGKADFFICASERQRLFYLGQLAGLGRVSPATYEDDPDLRGLIDIVPFGLDEIPPAHERDALKGIVAGIEKSDKVLLWSGGLYNWFDPRTLIHAIAQLSERHDNVRLFFQGTKHPHPGVPEMAIVRESRELAAELGVLNRSVFFNESWVEYADRQNYLTEADAGVSTHFSHIETTFSFRTRILDYLWAGLPMVVTEGDSFADLVAAEGLGIVVPSRDVDALEAALERILFDPELIAQSKANIARVREGYYWSNTLAPLMNFIRAPHRAADASRPSETGHSDAAQRRRKPYGIVHDLSSVVHHLRNSGPRVVLSKIVSRLRER